MRLTNPKVLSANDDTQGKQPVSIARQTAALWTEYALPGVLDGLTIGGGGRYVGTSYATSDNSLKVAGCDDLRRDDALSLAGLAAWSESAKT
ncbi:hypothetical protein LZ023_35875 (plasmid) [Pseudomonas silvicola]|nr:hypothetical protein LZ023_35875 [Pseudomonas silvicola]